MNNQNKIIRVMILLLIMLLCIQLVSAEEVTIELREGWNVLPITLDLESNDIAGFFEPILDDINIVREYANDGVIVYDPDIPFRFNTLRTIESGKAYQILMDQAGSLTLTGTSIPNEQRKINLHEGWNCMPYLGEEAMPIKDVLSEEVLSKIMIIREYSSEGVIVYDPNIPERFNTLTTFKPNHGYQIAMKEDAEIVFTSPEVIPPEVPEIGENIKKMEKYSEKQAFLISDENWRDVLPLVPVTTWTGDEDWCQKGYGTPDDVCVYPTLIWHEEDEGFDADSIIYFIQQYSPDKMTIVGQTPEKLNNLLIVQPELGAGLNENQLNRINTDDYFSYWYSYNYIIYVEDDYESALLASTYASLINAPLIIQNTELDKEDVFSGRNIICIGNVDRNCNEQYNLEQLQQKYVDETNTDKIILVNSDDWNMKVIEKFQPGKSTEYIYNMYGKSSLISPLLASAKHEIIISTRSTQYQEVDDFIEDKIIDLGISPKYLTIVSSPNTIPDTKLVDKEKYPLFFSSEETDGFYYGNMDADFFQELAVGRIYGITMSDISSQISRILFYNEISNFDNYLLISGDATMRRLSLISSTEQIIRSTGMNGINAVDITSPTTDINLLKDKSIILYWGHGYTSGVQGGINTNKIRSILLSPSIFIAEACSTCAFNPDKKPGRYYAPQNDLFCTNVIRQGAVAYIGAIRNSAGDISPTLTILNMFLNDFDLGNSFKLNKNQMNINFFSDYKESRWIDHDPYYVLLGDPTFKFPSKEINIANDKKTYTTFDSSNDIIIINVPLSTTRDEYQTFTGNFRYDHIKDFNARSGIINLAADRGGYKIYMNDEFSLDKIVDLNKIIFYLDFQKNKKVRGIKKIEYIDSETQKEVKQMPVFPAEDFYNMAIDNTIKDQFIFFYKDNSYDNRYWFYLMDRLGGDPPYVLNRDQIGPYQYKIYLELEDT